MPNYNEKSVIIPEIGFNFAFPQPSNFYDPLAERELALREFIFIMRYFNNRAGLTSGPWNPPFPYNGLYDNVLRYLVHTDPADPNVFVQDQNASTVIPLISPASSEALASSNYEDVLPKLINPLGFDPCLPIPVNPSEVANAMTLFTIFYLTRQLAFDTIYDKSLYRDWYREINPGLDITSNLQELFQLGDNTELRRIADIPLGSKSLIYQAFYSKLIKDPVSGEGFIPPTSNADKRAFNRMLDVRAYIGDYETDAGQTPNLSDPDPAKYFTTGRVMEPGNSSLVDGLTQQSLIHLLYSEMYLGNVPSSGGSGSRKYDFASALIGSAIDQRTAVLAKIKSILTDVIGEMSKQAIEYELSCVWKELFPSKLPPNSTLIATGNGSGTFGLFNSWNVGVMFFQYQYNSDSKPIVSNTKTIPNLKKIANSSLLLRTYGAQGVSYTATQLVVSFNYEISTSLGERRVPVTLGFAINGPVITLPNGSFGNGRVEAPVSSGQPARIFINVPSSILLPGAPMQIHFANWYASRAEMEFLYDQEFDVAVTQTSGTRSGDDDEVQSILSVVPDPRPFPIIISAYDLYRNDKFHMTKQRISRLMKSKSEIDAVDKIIDIILNDNATFQIVGLKGKFIGKLRTDSSGNPVSVYGMSNVVPDQDYIPHNSSTKKETGGIDPDLYDLLRYSFAKIDVDYGDCSNPKIQIDIESFVSPRHSTLKARMDDTSDSNATYTRDYRNFPIPIAPPTPPPAGTSPNGSLLDSQFTNSYIINSSGTDANGPWTVSGIKSYNQPLAILRCLGLLEGIAYRIRTRAAERFSISSPSSLATIITTLSNMLNTAVATDETAESRGITVSSDPALFAALQLPSPTISFTQYLNFKWYALKSIQRIDGPGGSGDPIVPGSYIDLIDPNTGYVVYEYFDYYHETWP